MATDWELPVPPQEMTPALIRVISHLALAGVKGHRDDRRGGTEHILAAVHALGAEDPSELTERQLWWLLACAVALLAKNLPEKAFELYLNAADVLDKEVQDGDTGAAS